MEPVGNPFSINEHEKSPPLVEKVVFKKSKSPKQEPYKEAELEHPWDKVKSATEECELFRSEEDEIEEAIELLDDLAPHVSDELFGDSADPEAIIDEFIALSYARTVLESYDLLGKLLFKRVFNALPYDTVVNLCFHIRYLNLNDEQLDRLREAPLDSLEFASYSLSELRSLVESADPQETKVITDELLQFPPVPAIEVYDPGSEEDDAADESFVQNVDRLTPMSVGGKKILETRRVFDKDDKDYNISHFHKIELPEGVTEVDAFAFTEALRGGDVSAAADVVTKTLETLDRAVDAKQIVTIVEQARVLMEELRDAQKQDNKSLPESAQRFEVYHAGFKRSREIAPFTDILLKKISGVVYGHVLEALQQKDPSIYEMETRIEETYWQALAMYKDVTKRGLPVFEEFASYLAEHATEGEFHVGRDTQMTMYIASNAFRWGTMSGAERKRVIKHVDISRPLIEKTTEATLRAFLKQEGVNARMMGVDGGLKGSSPETVLLTLNPDIGWDDLDRQIKLIQTENEKRRYDPELENYGYYEWLETLPKFTERSQRLERSSAAEFAPYLVVTKRRSEAERLLAWTVQHAVWRGLIPTGVKTNEPSEEDSEGW